MAQFRVFYYVQCCFYLRESTFLEHNLTVGIRCKILIEQVTLVAIQLIQRLVYKTGDDESSPKSFKENRDEKQYFLDIP